MSMTTLLAARLYDGQGTEAIRDAFIQIEDGTIARVAGAPTSARRRPMRATWAMRRSCRA